MNTIRLFSFFLITLFFIFLSAHTTLGATEDELRNRIAEKNKEIARLEEEIKQYQSGINGTAAAARNLQTEINRLNQEIKGLNQQIALTQTKIDKKNLEIETLSNEIATTTQTLISHEEALKESLRHLREVEEKSMFEVFLEYPSISSFFDVMERSKELESSIHKTYQLLVATRSTLQGKKQETEKTKTQLLALHNDLKDQISLEEDTKIEKNQILKITKNQEAAYQKLLKETEAARADILKEIQEIEISLQKLIDPNSLPSRGSRFLSWPVANPAITQEFGKTAFSKSTDVYKGSVHNGIDLRASIGTPILAAADGIVKETGDTDIKCRKGSYGKWIVVEHANNISTLYAHLSKIRVTSGTKVSRGDTIGLAGNTGYTTGPHLHFTVYASNTFRQAKTNNCGLIPAGGYLNPIDYL